MSFPSSQIYYINSEQRLNGTHGHFSFNIGLPSMCNFDRVCLLQANIPISYYLVSSGYNTFTLKERKSGVDTSVSITVPVGNYNTASFAATVPLLMNIASPNSWTYAMTFPNGFTSPQTGKFTYLVTGPTGADFASLVFGNQLNEQFGFNQNSTNDFVTNKLISANVVNFIPETSIILHSDIVDDGDTDILEIILSNNNIPLSNATYQCHDVGAYCKKLRTHQSNTYNFSLTDEHGKQLDLNGLPCIFEIILFKQDTVRDLMKDLVKASLT